MPIHIERIDPRRRTQVRRFVDLPFRLYANNPQWVPPLKSEIALAFDRRKHPFYERSDTDFFLAVRNGRDAGRIAALENRPFNDYHGAKHVNFYYFDCDNDPKVAGALIERVLEWAQARGLTKLIGPRGMTVLDGYGILVEGFQHRQMMTMTNYNHPYYGTLLEGLGFKKEVDFVSSLLCRYSFHMSDRLIRIASRVEERGFLRIKRFQTRRELIEWAPAIGRAYNQAFIRNWEYYPLIQREINFVLKNLILIADPHLIKLIIHDGQVVGFLFAFPDLSAALQRARGHLTPLLLIDLLREKRCTRWVCLNGAGILPAYQGHGGNALLYAEIVKTLLEAGFEHGDLPQVAETAVQMRRDLEELGAKPYKIHRVYQRSI